MESNNIILNNENFINTFQHFPLKPKKKIKKP